MTTKKEMLDLAEAQFLGFKHAQQGFGLIELVSSMGLTWKEWDKMADDCVSLTVEDKAEIDRYFKK